MRSDLLSGSRLYLKEAGQGLQSDHPSPLWAVHLCGSVLLCQALIQTVHRLIGAQLLRVTFPALTHLRRSLDPLRVRDSRSEPVGGEKKRILPSISRPLSPPSAWLDAPPLSASSFAPLLLPLTPPPLHTSPPNRAESVKNLTNGFICCQICADLSFPCTILLDTFHS